MMAGIAALLPLPMDENETGFACEDGGAKDMYMAGFGFFLLAVERKGKDA